MIEPITISFFDKGIAHTMTIPYDDNIPYNLAEAFRELIERTSANPEIVIDELKDNFNIK